MIVPILLILIALSAYILKLMWPLRVYKRFEFDLIITLEAVKLLCFVILLVYQLAVTL